MAVGEYAICPPGPAMAGGAFFDITITGKGAHGARPDLSIDSALVAAVTMWTRASRRTPQMPVGDLMPS